jgi:hypothetical protein
LNCQDRKKLPQGQDPVVQQQIKDILAQKRKLAMHLLKECGETLELCSSSNRIKLIFNHIELTYENEQLSLKGDGREFIDDCGSLMIKMAEDEYGKYPVILPGLQPTRFMWRKKQ